MADQFAGIISYLIGIGVMFYILFVLKGKKAEDPGMMLIGQPIQRLINLVIFGISIEALLIVAILMGWTKS